MDPNATLEMIEESIIDGDQGQARYLCENLSEWIYAGGYEPNWNKYRRAASFYRRYIN